eukprot:CAMPEP_0114684098 /NCGR_PEP_ID=MMETSP0191-20121206/58667_1 /TAXON_ID=126664 /ORGANISM="Sorites sp." /LENGTH=47 /DNA_ID= /DNA_START= /DNA_END= /DNA_ORIENTATION=
MFIDGVDDVLVDGVLVVILDDVFVVNDPLHDDNVGFDENGKVAFVDH